MKRQQVPQSVLIKLTELSNAAEYLQGQLTKTEDAISIARKRLSGGFAKDQEFNDTMAALNQMVEKDLPAIKRRQSDTQWVLSSCKVYLDQLPDGTVLEPVTMKADGYEIKQVRDQIRDRENELERLLRLPTPSADIEARLRNYVTSLAHPLIEGIGAGQKLEVRWPHDCAVAMMAFVHADKLVEVLMAEVTRMTNEVMAPKARGKRIAQLEQEIELWQRQAVALNADDLSFIRDLPAHVVLGVRVMNGRV
jgi:Tfp pilus assembly protein PilN